MHPLDRAHIYNARRKAVISRSQKLLNSTKTSAKARGLEHTIGINDIVIPEFCPVLGLKLQDGGTQDDSPSVDRKDSSLGYVAGNVRVISLRANRLKSNATLEELQALVNYMLDD